MLKHLQPDLLRVHTVSILFYETYYEPVHSFLQFLPFINSLAILRISFFFLIHIQENQTQPPEVLGRKSSSSKFRNIYRKAPALEFLFNKNADLFNKVAKALEFSSSLYLPCEARIPYPFFDNLILS